MSDQGFREEVLDHGYLALVEAWGSDEAIVRAARMSTKKGFLGWNSEYRHDCPRCAYVFFNARSCDGMVCPHCETELHVKQVHAGDLKLLRFMWDHQHATPFEFAGLVVEVKAPLMVFREWHRHRTWAYSEMSARYSPLPDENYVPSVERAVLVSKTNKQAGAAANALELTEAAAASWRKDLIAAYADLQAVYEIGLQVGVPKELARLPVPVGRYSVMRATANLRNVLAFIKLRSSPSAQWEIRQYSDALARCVAARFPRTWDVAKGSLGL